MKKKNQNSANDEITVRSPIVEQEEHITPRTPVEEIIAAVCASYLNVSSIGIYDNLSALGFTPQVAARLRLWLQKIFHVDVTVEQLLLWTNIENIVKHLSELWGGREIVEEIAWTFLQVEQLSDDEVRSQLRDECANVQVGVEEPDQERSG